MRDNALFYVLLIVYYCWEIFPTFVSCTGCFARKKGKAEMIPDLPDPDNTGVGMQALRLFVFSFRPSLVPVPYSVRPQGFRI